MDYGIHPSKELLQLFKERSFQGQQPEKAKVLILGNDANYSPEISEDPFFQNILDYHSDGVGFWKKTSVHHPFLLPTYPFPKNAGGVPYHRKFSKMGFTSNYAEKFSFIELLNVPTTGNTGSNKAKFYDLMDIEHLEWLEDLIFSGSKKLVLLNKTLSTEITKISKDYRVLKKLNNIISTSNTSPILFEDNNTLLYGGYSFSASISNKYINDLSLDIHSFINSGIKSPKKL